MAKEFIKDFYGRILGTTEEQGTRITARDFYGRILGYYESKDDTTRDFYGRIVSKGNTVTGLIYQANNK